jgi:Zn-dependent peptidase ImmA (M78 family)
VDLDRIELADVHDPRALARMLSFRLGTEVKAVPVVEIAQALDIAEVRIAQFDGFEGMLVTDRVRSYGAILANSTYGNRRARFTVAHELGHFLLERHRFFGRKGFLCRTEDMGETRIDRLHRRQETEANLFAIELLAPARVANQRFGKEPDLRDAQRLRDDLDISLEAAVRRMVDLRPEPLAAVFIAGKQIRYVVRGQGFPWISRQPGERPATVTDTSRAIRNATIGFTEMTETSGIAWTDNADLDLFEQTRIGSNGQAVTLLWATGGDAEVTDGEDDMGMPGMPRFR